MEEIVGSLYIDFTSNGSLVNGPLISDDILYLNARSPEQRETHFNCLFVQNNLKNTLIRKSGKLIEETAYFFNSEALF